MYALPCTECNVTFIRDNYQSLSQELQRHLVEDHNLVIVEIPDA